jgi:hypothetical protein
MQHVIPSLSSQPSEKWYTARTAQLSRVTVYSPVAAQMIAAKQ